MTTHPLPGGHAPAALDDALEAALAGTPGATPPAEVAAAVASLTPVAAALAGVPALDPTRRAAIAATLSALAAASADAPSPTADAPASGDDDRPGDDHARRNGAVTLAGLLLLVLVGTALWRHAASTDVATPAPPAAPTAPLDGAIGAPATAPDRAAAAATAGADAAATTRPLLAAADRARTPTSRAAAVTAPTSTGVGRSSRGATGAAGVGVGARDAAPEGRGDAASGSPAPGGAGDAGGAPAPAEGGERPPSRRSTATRPPAASPTTAPPTTDPGPTATSMPATVVPATATLPATGHPCASLVQPNAIVARVVDDAGRPLAGAFVALFAVGVVDFSSIGTTAADGCAAVEQAPGRYDVRAEAAGHDVRWFPDAPDRASAVAVAIDDRGGVTAPLDLVLPRAPMTSTAAPAATATIAASDAPPPAPSPTIVSDRGPAISAGDATASDGADRAGARAGRTLGSDARWGDPPTGRTGSAGAAGAAAVPDALRRRLDALAAFDQDGGAVTAAAVAGAHRFAVVGARVLAWPLSAGDDAPPQAWTPILPDVPEALAVDGDRLIAAVPGASDGPATLWLFDAARAGVAGGGELPRLGALELDRSGATGIVGAAADDTWIVVRTDLGLSIVDAKRAAAPFEAGFLPLPAAAIGRSGAAVALVDGAHAVVAAPSGLLVIDIRDAAAPRLVHAGDGRAAFAVAEGDGGRVIAVEADLTGPSGAALRLSTIDVADPSQPRRLAATTLPASGHAAVHAGLAVAGGQAVVVAAAADGPTLWRVDVRDALRPVAGAPTSLGAAAADAAAVALGAAADDAFVALGGRGLVRSRRADSEAWGDGARAILPPVAQWAPAADGRTGWGAAGPAGLVAFAVGATDGATVGRRVGAAPWPGGVADSVAVVGRTAFALGAGTGLAAFDVGDPRQVRSLPLAPALAAIAGGDRPVQLAAADGRLYVPEPSGAVHVIAIAGPGGPRSIGRVDVAGAGDGRLAALAVADGTLYALATDARDSRVHAWPLDGPSGLPVPGPAIALTQRYRRLHVAGDTLILSGDRSRPGLAVVNRRDAAAPPLEVPGLAAGEVGLVDLPGGFRRLLVADDGYLTALDLDAMADPARRVSGRSVRLPHGRRADGGTTDVRIVGDQVVVTRGEAGLFSRPHGGIALPQPPAAVPPGAGAPGAARHRLFLPSLSKHAGACPPPARRHGVLLVDTSPAAARWLADGPSPSFDPLAPAVSAWLDGVGVGTAPGASASVVGWSAQADHLASGRDPAALLAPLRALQPVPGRRIDAALAGAAVQLAVRDTFGAPELAGEVVAVAAAGWDDEVHAAAVAQGAALRRRGWRLTAVAVGSDGPRDALAAITGDARAVTVVTSPAELPGALRAAAGAGRCGR